MKHAMWIVFGSIALILLTREIVMSEVQEYVDLRLQQVIAVPVGDDET